MKDGFTNLVSEKLRVPLTLQRADGGEVDVEIAAISYEGDERDSAPDTVLVIARDVTERNRTIRKLAEREEHIRKIMDTVVDGILTIDQSGFIETVNPAAESLFKYRPGELSGQNISALLSQEPATYHDNFMTRFLAAEDSRPMGNRRPVTAVRKDGSVIPVEITIALMKAGEQNLFIAVVRDITERQKHEQRLRDMATRDPLTHMPNRTLFNERLDEELERARSTGARFAVIFVDLDHFKYINDAMGHVIGDRVIQEAGARLRNCVGPSDLMAHFGGDEFSAILSDIRCDADVADVASRMLAALTEPFQMEDREIFTSGSLGIVLYPEHAGTVSELIKNVDTACHKAKQEGRNNYQFYTQKLSADVKRRMEIESGLRRALENDEFTLYYQPKVDLRSHRLVGAEALLRWETDHMGFVSPAEFVPVAEDMGLIAPIGEWVLRHACADAAEWTSDTDHPIHVGVNLSARQFLQGDLTEKVVNSLYESGLPPERLDLELTESMLVENPDQTIRTLESLRELGAHTSMDDFGTGYSSLSYLTRFPLDSLKIDRAFVTNLPGDKDSVAIATAIVSMAKNLQLKIVAEGIETKSQMRFLNHLGCRIGQGYLYSRPVPGLDFRRLLRMGSAAFNV